MVLAAPSVVVSCNLSSGDGIDPNAMAAAPKARPSATPSFTAPPNDARAPAELAVDRVVSFGGYVATEVDLTLVVFPGDPVGDTLTVFGEKALTSTWFSSATSEYGIKAGLGRVLRPTVLPREGTRYEIGFGADGLREFFRTLVALRLLPPPTARSVYGVYLPPTTSFVTSDGKRSCEGTDGYHATFGLSSRIPERDGGSGADSGRDSGPDAAKDAGAESGLAEEPELDVPFFVVPRCGAQTSLPDAESLVRIGSRLLVDTVTNPRPWSAPALLLDSPGRAALVTGERAAPQLLELASACGGASASGEMSTSTWRESGLTLARVWSAASALSGRNPCVPIYTAEPYASVVPLDAGWRSHRLGVGETGRFRVRGVSPDRNGIWDLVGSDLGSAAGDDALVRVEVDPPRVTTDGDSEVRVTLLAKPKQGSSAFYRITSKHPSGRDFDWVGQIEVGP